MNHFAFTPYMINSDAIVPDGDSLIIEPGVEVKFKTGTDITHSGDDSVDGLTADLAI